MVEYQSAAAAAAVRYENFLRSSKPGAWDHIKALKDMLTVQLSPEPAAAAAAASGSTPGAAAGGARDESGQGAQVPWVCPIAHVPLGRYPCCALKGCGHVISKKVLDELLTHACKARSTDESRGTTPAVHDGSSTSGTSMAKPSSGTVGSALTIAGETFESGSMGIQVSCRDGSSSSSACPVCGKMFTRDELLPLNGSAEQQEALLAKLQTTRHASGGKGHKRKASKAAAGEDSKGKRSAGLKCVADT
jgi:hypothetical protein